MSDIVASPSTPPFPDLPRATVPALLAHAVREHGDHDFVVTATERCTFREAGERSRRLARHLLAAGVGKGARVALFLPSGVAFVTAWLALARIGAVSTMLSTTSRAPELRAALRLGDAGLLLTIPEVVGRDVGALVEEALPFPAGAAPDRLLTPEAPYLRSVWFIGDGTDPRPRAWSTTVDVEHDDPSLPVDDAFLALVEAQVQPADPVTVIFTSGSTALPKAIVHSHGVAVRKTGPGVRFWPDLTGPHRYFCAMPFFWIGGLQMMLSALHHGGTVVAQPRFDAAEAARLIEEEHCAEISGWVVDAIPGIERVARMSPAQRWGFPVTSSRGDPRHLGMTETFGPHFDRRFFEYGILDPETGATLPEGETGEFCIRGPGMMLGMLGREHHEVFDDDGFLHTGDLGYVEDGHVYFTGRAGEMLKSAGANVSPLEVEQALVALPGVDAAFVFGVPTSDRGESVAAVVVTAQSTTTLDPAELQARLREVISPYKVPTLIATADRTELPLLASGKVDKRSLSASMIERWAAAGTLPQTTI